MDGTTSLMTVDEFKRT